MSLLNENPRISDVILFEEGVEVEYTRDTVTIASGTVASGVGQLMGKVTATGKFTQLTPAAADGSQNAAGVLLESISATLAADTQLNVLTRGPAVVKAPGLVYTAGMTNPQILAAQAALVALGIKVEGAY
jgi:hypothetical protein